MIEYKERKYKWFYQQQQKWSWTIYDFIQWKMDPKDCADGGLAQACRTEFCHIHAKSTCAHGRLCVKYHSDSIKCINIIMRWM